MDCWALEPAGRRGLVKPWLALLPWLLFDADLPGELDLDLFGAPLPLGALELVRLGWRPLRPRSASLGVAYPSGWPRRGNSAGSNRLSIRRL